MTRKNKPTKTKLRKAIEKAKRDNPFSKCTTKQLDDLIDFVFPDGLDKIHPIQKDGNLTIQFPE